MNDAAIVSRPEDVGLSSERLARIDAWRDKLVADDKFAGVATLVSRRGQVAHWGMSGHADKALELTKADPTLDPAAALAAARQNSAG